MTSPGDPSAKEASAVDQIAHAVRNLLGGDNENQFFTLLMPGTVIDPSRYAYDVNGPKPASVAVAESHLTNQLFDVCQITASPNGRHLGDQFITALNTLVPKFSPELTAVKNALRGFLRTRTSCVVADGSTKTGTVQELYFLLYNDWVQEKEKWEKEMRDARNAAVAAHGNTRLAEDEYIQWYEMTAEGRLLELDARMAKVLAFFSPSDMATILGVLDSGPGGIIEEARQAVDDAERPTPDGGRVYPVNLLPADWFTSLLSESDPDDMLDSPLYVGQRLQARRSALVLAINQVKALIAERTSDADMKTAKDDMDAAQATYETSRRTLLGVYGDNLLVAYEVYKAIQGARGGQVPSTPSDVTSDVVKEVGKNKTTLDSESTRKGDAVDNQGSDKIGDALKKIVAGQKELAAAQDGFVTSLGNYVNAANKWVAAAANNYDVTPYLLRLQSEADEVKSLQTALADAVSRKVLLEAAAVPAGSKPTAASRKSAAAADAGPAGDADGDSGTAEDKPTGTDADSSPLPRSGASSGSRFMQLMMSFDTSTMNKKSDMFSYASRSDVQVDFFLGSYSSSSASSSAYSSTQLLDKDQKIEIGMKLTKVDIDRPWFNPGVFAASRDMNRMSDTPISTGPVKLLGFAGDGTVTKAGQQEANQALFPAFPVSFVIAKDISIRFSATTATIDATKSVVESRAASGGGFLCFSSSSAYQYNSEHEDVHAKSDGKSITLRIPAPQIIGWFSEFVAKDDSVKIDPGAAAGSQLGSVLKFIDACTKQLKENAPASAPSLTGSAVDNGQTLPALN